MNNILSKTRRITLIELCPADLLDLSCCKACCRSGESIAGT